MSRSVAEAKAPSESGVLVVDKPKGPTSHDVVDRVRRATGVRRVGHTGTLDPFATGVLPVCVGKATRLVRFLSGGEKVYEATVRLGFDTTTDDLLGEPLGTPREVFVTRARLEDGLQGLVGEIDQRAPAYSAKRVAGRRLYELAREGVVAETPRTRVTVHAITVLDVRVDEVDLQVRCSPGTYVRAIARDLGAALGTGGHLTALRRLQSGGFTLEQAISWDDLEAAVTLLPLRALLPEMPSAVVGGEGRDAVRHGRALDRRLVLAGFPDAPVDRLRIIDESGELLALAVPQGIARAGQDLPSRPLLQPDVVLTD